MFFVVPMELHTSKLLEMIITLLRVIPTSISSNLFRRSSNIRRIFFSCFNLADSIAALASMLSCFNIADTLCDLCLDPSEVGVLRNRCQHNLIEKLCFFDLFAYFFHQGRFTNPSHSINPDQVGITIFQCFDDFLLGG
ncbi:hypothetical protein GIB67_007185, partial [Kingdonia uniflora]